MVVFTIWLLLALHVRLGTGFGQAYVVTQSLLLVGAVVGFFLLRQLIEKRFPRLNMIVYLALCYPLKSLRKSLLNKHNAVAVIARYDEDISWSKHLNTTAIIYNKGAADIDADCEIIRRPNEGHESESYMRYIIDHYDSLPLYVVFMQGDPFAHCLWLLGLIRIADGSLTPLGKNSSENSAVLLRQGGLMNKLAIQVLEKLSLDDTYQFCPGAQYIVPREKITNKSLQWWRQAYAAYMAFDAATELPTERSGELLNGHVFERIWPLIWEYSTEPSSSQQ